MTAAGIIFSNIHDSNIPELTRIRTLASIPFGCRYRLVDFALSNMVNSDISNIHIITHYNYQSLMDHVGSGKDWDLARRSGGVKILPPYITAYANNVNSLYNTRMEALKSVNYSISNIKDDYVVLSDCDVICNVDFHAIIRDHIEHGADVTIAVKRMKLTPETAKRNILIRSDENGRIIDFEAYPVDFSGVADVNLNIMVMSTQYLKEIVLDAIAHGYTSMTRDVFAHNLAYRNYRVYTYNGYFASISSMDEYFKCNMDLIQNESIYRELFDNENRPIYTKVRNSAPTYYSDSAVVRDSLIADGCRIEGTVENSILFRGVKVGKNSVVRNSILYQDVVTGENVTLGYVIADKNVVIRDGITLSGAESLPFYIEKGKMI